MTHMLDRFAHNTDRLELCDAELRAYEHAIMRHFDRLGMPHDNALEINAPAFNEDAALASLALLMEETQSEAIDAAIERAQVQE